MPPSNEPPKKDCKIQTTSVNGSLQAGDKAEENNTRLATFYRRQKKIKNTKKMAVIFPKNV